MCTLVDLITDLSIALGRKYMLLLFTLTKIATNLLCDLIVSATLLA